MNVLEKILEEMLNYERVVKTDEDLEWNRAMYRCSEIIHSHMDEMNNDDWITVEERLPKETEKEYYPVMYVTTSYGVVAWGFYRVKDEQWYLYNDIMEEFESVENNKIVAWQPLPKPYKPKEQNNGK